MTRAPRRTLHLVPLVILVVVQTSAALAQPAAPDDLHAALVRSLAAPGWVTLPAPITNVRYSGLTAGVAPGKSPGPPWFLTTDLDDNDRPHVNAEAEAAFVRSIERAHARAADAPRLVECGVVLLVDPQRRIWCVAAHLPHLLRCYDGRGWTFRRADGLPDDADAPADFARRAAAGSLPRPDYAPGGLRDLNDFGRWYQPACADAAGNLHFLAACNARDAADRAARDAAAATPGGGVHTLRPDGTWSYFRVYPPEMPRHEMRLDSLRWVVHAPAPNAPNLDAPKPDALKPDAARPPAAGEDLVTLTELQLSDPVAQAHGLAIEPIPPGADALRRQQWQDHTDKPRSGPVYFLRSDGRAWRFDRSAVGWGVYDMVFGAWPQPDGRVYLANRFGLWEQWPPRLPPQFVERLVADLFEVDPAKQARAAETLVAMGRGALPGLRNAVEQASAESTRRRLRDLAAAAEKVARGEEAAVPLVAGRWRFFRAYPQATMPDGRFAFACERVTDTKNQVEMKDCLVTFDPARSNDPDGPFDIRPIDRGQWNTTDFYDKRANEPPLKGERSVLDLSGGLWVPGGYRCAPDGRITRLVPAGFTVRIPHFADGDGRVYFRGENLALHFLRPPDGRDAEPVVERVPPGEAEVQVENVRGLFTQPDLPPPWNAWALQERGAAPPSLLRLDGPEPTRVDLPPAIRSVSAVVPLDGGCVVAGMGPAGYWDGDKWDVAPDVKTLVQRYARRFAESVPTRVFAADTSAFRFNHLYEYQLMLASDGRGGLWLAEDTPPGFAAGDPAAPFQPPPPPPGGRGFRKSRRLWHFDGERFTDLWSLLPLPPERDEDGAVLTAAGGRALVVQLKPNNNVRPGGYWQIWRVTEEDLRQKPAVPETAHRPGFYPELLAALGPNTVFSEGLWADREGWVWSPLFLPGGGRQWVRRHDTRLGMTPFVVPASTHTLVQGRSGPAWCVTGMAHNRQAVWADVSPTGDQPKHYSRTAWVGTQLPGMTGGRVAIAPDDTVYLLHEGGCSLLRLRKLAPGEKPALHTHTTARAATQPATTQPAATRPAATRPAATQAADGGEAPIEWEIEEVARRKWRGPRNDFSRIAFDKTGVWFLPTTGPLIRAPLPVAGEKGGIDQ